MLGIPLVLLGGLGALIVVNNRARARVLDRETPPDGTGRGDDRDDAAPPLAKAS
jgi:hypothetical protein